MSKLTNNFAGLNGFIWWTGVVEDREDPLKLGRCRVRIFGWHTENKQLIPTEDLPWALPVLPINNSDNFGTPVEGAYVTGFFADSESGQFPMLLGVLPGIVTTPLSPNINSGFYDPRTPAQVAAAPQVPPGQIQQAQGQPTTSPLARGVFNNTPYQKAYQNLAHNCDITIESSLKIAEVKAFVMGIITKIRTAIEALFAGTEPSPFFEQIKQAIAYIKTKIKMIQKELQPIVDAVEAIKEYIQFAKDMINFILSLPQYLINLLKDCLSQFTSSITDAQQQVLSAVNTVSSAKNLVVSAVNTLTTTAQSLSVTTIANVVKPALA